MIDNTVACSDIGFSVIYSNFICGSDLTSLSHYLFHHQWLNHIIIKLLLSILFNYYGDSVIIIIIIIIFSHAGLGRD